MRAVRNSLIVLSGSELTERCGNGFPAVSLVRVETSGHLFLEYLGVISYTPENP